MKKILCKVTEVKLNTDFYGSDFYDNYETPKVGDEIVVERQDWYPFKENGSDGEGTYPKHLDQQAIDSGKSNILYYTKLEQLSIIE